MHSLRFGLPEQGRRPSFWDEYHAKLTAATLEYARSPSPSHSFQSTFQSNLETAWQGKQLPDGATSDEGTALLNNILKILDQLKQRLLHAKKTPTYTSKELENIMVSSSHSVFLKISVMSFADIHQR